MAKIIEFGTTMRPSSRMNEIAPPDRTNGEGVEPMHRGTAGGLMIMKILTMPNSERVKVVSDQVEDPLVVWFAMLSPRERREFLFAAENDLQSRIT